MLNFNYKYEILQELNLRICSQRDLNIIYKKKNSIEKFKLLDKSKTNFNICKVS